MYSITKRHQSFTHIHVTYDGNSSTYMKAITGLSEVSKLIERTIFQTRTLVPYGEQILTMNN